MSLSDQHPPNSVANWTLSKFLDDPGTQPPEFLVQGVLPERSITLLTAQPGSGKSMFATELLLSIARGDPFGGLETKQAPVLFIGEDSASWDYANIARKFLNGEPTPSNYFAWVKQGFLIDDPAACDRLKRDAKDAGVKGIVLDSFRFVHRKDENRSDEMQEVMNAVRDVAEFTGAGILVVHHPSKPTAFGSASDFRGSSVILASCDFHLNLSSAKLQGQSARALNVSFEKGRCADTPESLELVLSWGNEWASIEANDTAQFVRDELLIRGGAMVAELVELLVKRNPMSESRARKVVDQTLKRMERAGTVSKTGDRKNGFLWSVRPSGK